MKLPPIPKPTIIDRAVAIFSPESAVRRMHARTVLNLAGQYSGARTDRTALKNWLPRIGSADSDSIGDLDELRSRSRDLVRNEPIATGAVSTVVTSTVGTGLKLRSAVDREILKLDEDEAEAWERRAERIFRIWAESQACDAALRKNFAAIQRLAFRSTLENGDVFVVRRYIERPGAILGLSLQLVEADRVSTPDYMVETDLLKAGVELDRNGAPVKYWVRDTHPGETMWQWGSNWTPLPAFGPKSGTRIVLHLMDELRVDQTRGVPYLAPVIEALKQLGRYSESELMAAVVSAMFTVFIKSKNGDGLGDLESEGIPSAAAGEYMLGSGAIVDLGPDEEIDIANPARPNANFDPFFIAIVRQIGVALELPFEILVKHFTASYSASRAALEMAWQFFRVRRSWLAGGLCQPVYEWVIAEAVARGLLVAPGFFDDPIVRRAWLGSEWIGDAKISLDPLKDSKADEIDIRLGTRSRSDVTAERTGRDWERTHQQTVREEKMRRAAGLSDQPTAAAAAPEDPEENARDEE